MALPKCMLGVLFLAGCQTVAPAELTASQRQVVQIGVASALHNPRSAQFSLLAAVRASNGRTLVCGSVNAQGPRGRMTGPTPFFVAVRGKQFELLAAGGGPEQNRVVKAACSAVGIII